MSQQCIKERFWLEHFPSLFKKMRILPKDNMTLAEQMNALTRLVFLFFFVLYLLGYRDSLLFLFLSLFFIIILYYLQKGKMTSYETYEPEVSKLPAHAIFPKPTTPYVPQQFSPVQIPDEIYKQQQCIAKSNHLYNEFKSQPRTTFQNHPSYYNQQVGKDSVVTMDQRQKTTNQKLVGTANPKTMMKPIVAPPAYEWTYWKDNDFVLPAQINTRSIQDYYSSGYYVDQPPTNVNDEMKYMKKSTSSATPTVSLLRNRKEEIVEHYQPTPVDRSNYYFRSDQPNKGTYMGCDKDACSYGGKGITPIEKDNNDFMRMKKRETPTKYTGDIDDAVGYDPTNLDYHLPSNYPATNCQRDSSMKDYNKQIFTSTIVPGVYYNTEIIEPISSNIGISFDQQVPPRKITKDEYGNVIYEAKDPRVYEPEIPKQKEWNMPNTYDVYDPRFDGYGSSDRSYVDKMTGQPRFYYDDVDAIRKPNYVTRSNIDFLERANSYGQVNETDEEISLAERIRLEADTSYMNDTLDFRTEMMSRLMRKRNAELWQNRMAPKTTMKK
jgi:hypothetical protein